MNVDDYPLVSIRMNIFWARALLSLVSHADRQDTWTNAPNIELVEENAYKLFEAIRNMTLYDMIGTIVAYATVEPPTGCLVCDGSLHARADYPLLYEQLDPELIVNDNMFRTPDLRERFVLGAGDENPPHWFGGQARVTLSIEQMPAHSHVAQPHHHTTQPHHHVYWKHGLNIDVEAPGVPDLLGAGEPSLPQHTSSENIIVNDAIISINETGGNESHNNMPPYYALKYAIVAK